MINLQTWWLQSAHIDIVLGTVNLLQFIFGTIAIVLLPGPNSMYVLAAAVKNGKESGFAAAAGVWVGDLILMLVTALGMVSLLMTSPLLFNVLRYAGSAYLLYLGAGLLLQAKQAWQQWRYLQHHPADLIAPLQFKDQSKQPFTRALTISLLNPKAIFFFAGYFVQFVDPHYAYPAISFALLALIVTVCSMAYLIALIYGGGKLANVFHQRPHLRALGNGITGFIFIGFASKLYFSHA